MDLIDFLFIKIWYKCSFYLIKKIKPYLSKILNIFFIIFVLFFFVVHFYLFLNFFFFFDIKSDLIIDNISIFYIVLLVEGLLLLLFSITFIYGLFSDLNKKLFLLKRKGKN